MDKAPDIVERLDTALSTEGLTQRLADGGWLRKTLWDARSEILALREAAQATPPVPALSGERLEAAVAADQHVQEASKKVECGVTSARDLLRAILASPALTSHLCAMVAKVRADYEEVLADKRDLVRRLDVALNGENAAPQASLCDLVAQFEAIRSRGPCSSPPSPSTEGE